MTIKEYQPRCPAPEEKLLLEEKNAKFSENQLCKTASQRAVHARCTPTILGGLLRAQHTPVDPKTAPNPLRRLFRRNKVVLRPPDFGIFFWV